MISTRKLTICICLVVLLSAFIVQNNDLVQASGKKKFLKGFILGALLSKNHYPVVYTMPSHGHGGGHHGGYGF